jgi:superfamily II DNA or RNA helicase
VDRKNLGEQAETEFQSYRTPDDNRPFTELYNVQRLTSNTIGSSAKVVITTIQRLYSMLRGDADLDPSLEEGSQFDTGGQLLAQSLPVTYNAAIPIEFFDVIWVDECHRSIYSLWRQVLEYFDAYLIGLTATPSKQTFGFFNQNLVMEYGHDQAVADGVNVGFEVYRIRTRITQQGATIEAGSETVVGIRDRQTRRVRWERPTPRSSAGSSTRSRAGGESSCGTAVTPVDARWTGPLIHTASTTCAVIGTWPHGTTCARRFATLPFIVSAPSTSSMNPPSSILASDLSTTCATPSASRKARAWRGLRSASPRGKRDGSASASGIRPRASTSVGTAPVSSP